jgi:FixJ family two-component response regulator
MKKPKANMIRISLIDDDSQDITRLRGCLERYDKEHSIGFSYTLFDNAQKFLATDMSETDLLILDIDMPGLNGIEAAKLVRKTNALLPIVFVTNLFQYAIQGYQVNAIDYIVKPVEYESLSLKIERILEIVRSLSSKKATVSTDKGTRVIDLNQIIYIEVPWTLSHLSSRRRRDFRDPGQYLRRRERASAERLFALQPLLSREPPLCDRDSEERCRDESRKLSHEQGQEKDLCQ